MRDHMLSIVIPAYNEAAVIAGTLDAIACWAARRDGRCELIVVDDGSTDGTDRIVRERLASMPFLRLIVNRTNRGKGFSVRTGMLAAEGDYLLFTDADLSTPVEDANLLERSLDEGADIAIASRYCDGASIEEDQPAYRKIMGRVFNAAVRLLAVPGVCDSQCGFKMLRRECARHIFSASRIDGFCFDVEMLYIARRAGMRVRETPVRWRNCPHSSIRALRDSFRMFRDILRVRLNSLLGRYEVPR